MNVEYHHTCSVPAWVYHFSVCDACRFFFETLTSQYHILALHDRAMPYNENDELHEF